VSCSWELAVRLYLLHCVAELGSGFSCCWSLLRNNIMVHFRMLLLSWTQVSWQKCSESETVIADSGKPRSFILCEKKPEWIYSNVTTSLKYPLQVWDWVCDRYVWVNSLIQHGPTTFYLRAILQNVTTCGPFPIKWCIKQQVHNIEKWKREHMWVRHLNYYTIAIYY